MEIFMIYETNTFGGRAVIRYRILFSYFHISADAILGEKCCKTNHVD